MEPIHEVRLQHEAPVRILILRFVLPSQVLFGKVEIKLVKFRGVAVSLAITVRTWMQ